jgi:predicted RNA-binding protein Jag
MQDKTQEKMEFPSTLNSWERQVIHAYCEIIKIKHESYGEGMNRHIVITKPKHLVEKPKPQPQ